MGFNFCVNVRYKYRRVTGVERYAGEVVNRLGNKIRRLDPEYPLGGFLGHLWEQFYLPCKIQKGELLWSPANTGPIFIRNQVVTVFDLSPIEHPEWFRREFAVWYRFLLPLLIKGSRKVITISNFSKRKIAECMHIPEEKIVVAHGGVNRDIFQPVDSSEVEMIIDKYGLAHPFILAMEPQNPRKNARTLLRAWDDVCNEFPNLSLIFINSSNGAMKALQRVTTHRRIVLLNHVSDYELAALMGVAEVFVYPSLYEGFGLPVLEAMACGTPVIASNVGGLLEAVGEDGILVDPLDCEGLARKINLVLSDSDCREREISRGLNRVESYSWDITAEVIEQTLYLASGMG
jgi:glycosyltransferase involved in cell wall biosynthesis